MFMQFKKFLFLFLLSPVLVGCQKLDFSNIDFTQFYSIEAEVVGNYDYSNMTFSLALNKEVYIKNKTIYNSKYHAHRHNIFDLFSQDFFFH